MGNRRIATITAILIAGFSTGALAQKLPAVKLDTSNPPPQCVTPGRLMALIRERNPSLAPKFQSIAADYMRHGQELGVRWDYAFYQMVVETNALKFTGDVHVRQNNFAGLGATGGGVPGESFRTVSDGVRAHLEHLLIYAGVHVADPVADRTRKVQSWRILDRWRRTVRGPVTYSDVGTKWAPVDRGYAQDMQAIARLFHSGHCNRPDPNPEMLAGLNKPNYDTAKRASLGVGTGGERRSTTVTQSYSTLNATAAQKTEPAADEANTTVAKFAVPSIKPPPGAKKCRVWTASYGGSKATIIQSSASETVNYTVLDVNPGREEAETKAYIAAYAKGGRRIADYPTKSAAMAKAFELCPEG